MRQAAKRLLAPQFVEAVGLVEQPILQPIFDLESQALAFGRVALLGDAAFVARPHVGAGVAKAAGDAASLTNALAAEPDIPVALRRYEAERLPKTTGIVLRNRMNGPEQVMQLAESRAPQGFKNIEEVIPRQTLEAISLRYKRLAGFDKDSLKAKP